MAWQLADLTGTWDLIPDQSTDIGRFGTVQFQIAAGEGRLRLAEDWGRGRWQRALELPVDGRPHAVPVEDRVFPANIYTSLSYVPGSERTCSATWSDSGCLTVEERFEAATSQGRIAMRVEHTYQLAPTGAGLVYTAQRSTRAGHAPRYVLRRAGTGEAWMVEMGRDWTVAGGLAEQAGIISVQGIANRAAPQLYLVYPPEWDFKFTPHVLEYLRAERHMSFAELRSLDEVIGRFREQIEGYIVWDRQVRTSLIVAFTLAGLTDAVVVAEEQIPMAEAHGLAPVHDFRGQFTGQTDAEIYTWAYDEYWDRCSRDYIVWLGGPHGNQMMPGVADWGMRQRAFFTDLSVNPAHAEERALASQLLSEQNKYSLVFGWHSYGKDTEEQHVALTSSYALRVEGLHSLPNMSFSCQIPLTPGFRFRNNHSVEPGQVVTPEEKVYVACIQTDCLGIGAWTEPGRGEIPYAWEVTMNWVWLAPAMMEFFYSQATENDYFVGALSGPGYMYPRSVPAKDLPHLVAQARELMAQLDLRVFEIMEYTDGGFYLGSPDLPRAVVDAYYEGMPQAIGFVNGYAPAHTFAVRDKRPLISYDYYLSPTQTEEDATADLEELAVANPRRPYFLLVHVRNFSDIRRVVRMVERLSSQFELVPLDTFVKMAGEQPTFVEHYREEG